MENIVTLVKNRDKKSLDAVKLVPVRMVIERLKNDTDDLEYFFKWFSKWGDYLPGAGSYHYTDVKDVKTFDIYHKYEFLACNLYREKVTQEQWDHMLSIGYITKKGHRKGWA